MSSTLPLDNDTGQLYAFCQSNLLCTIGVI